MTLEEAAEIVLEGEPWKRCSHCNGKGWARLSDPDGEGIHRDDCYLCENRGFYLSPRVVEAYQLLHLELPLKPISLREVSGKLGESFRRLIDEPSVTQRIFSRLKDDE